MQDELREQLRQTEADAPREAGIFSFDDEITQERLKVLSSRKAREIFQLLQREELPAPDIGDTLDLSTQTVHYHIGRLLDANLVTVVDSGISEKGGHMDIFAAQFDPLLLTCSTEESLESENSLQNFINVGLFLSVLSILIGTIVNVVPATESGGSSESGTGKPALSIEVGGGASLTDPATGIPISFVLAAVFLLGGLIAIGSLWIVQHRM